MARRTHFSLRLPDPVLQRLSNQAAMTGGSKTALAETYLREAIAMTDHPGIIFREGPAGRRARMIGGPDVWEVIETFLDEKRRVDATARYLAIPPSAVTAAVGYYADNRDEIDTWIARNAAEAERAKTLWQSRQAILGE